MRRDAELTGQIKEIHADSGGVYGSPRVHAVLKREGVHVGRKRVERLMREAGIAGISPRRRGSTRRDPQATPAPDLVQRDFTACAPNRLWADIAATARGRRSRRRCSPGRCADWRWYRCRRRACGWRSGRPCRRRWRRRGRLRPVSQEGGQADAGACFADQDTAVVVAVLGSAPVCGL
ncbi:IS3 family transposase [Streptomyces sp. ID05-04B]|uniref:IS3 family transposase n=1 Tax=Streptomyces sp. ID05-04B TaxID=3028661 RepID=UPI0039F6EB39